MCDYNSCLATAGAIESDLGKIAKRILSVSDIAYSGVWESARSSIWENIRKDALKRTPSVRAMVWGESND